MIRPAYGAVDGHGRYGILDRDDDGRLLCHECGRWWRHLATHARAAHGVLAADYRARHGLSSGTALVDAQVSGALRAAIQAAPERVERLAEHRDPARARAAMTPRGQWAPELVAGRRARAHAARVDLTAEQLGELGDVTDLQGWADRARALMARDGVTGAAISRATGLAAATVSQRLRRYPPR